MRYPLTSLLLLTIQFTVNAATAPIKTNKPLLPPPEKELAPVTFVPLKLGNYNFLQGDKAFADKVVNYQAGSPEPQKKYQDANKALGLPDYKKVGYDSFVSLGCKGHLIVKFTDNSLVDGDGNDLLIYEVGPSMEPTKVEISKNGSHWITVGLLKGRTKAIDLNGKVSKGEQFYFVKLTDNKQGKCKKLKKGISVDPYNSTAGADIDAVASLNSMPTSQPPLVNTSTPIATQEAVADVDVSSQNEQGLSDLGGGADSINSRPFKITSAKQVMTNDGYQIQVKMAKPKNSLKDPRGIRLVYWGDGEPIHLNMFRPSKTKKHLIFKIPKNTFADQNFARSKGRYKIGFVESYTGDFVSNTLAITGDPGADSKTKITGVNGLCLTRSRDCTGYELTLLGTDLPDKVVGEVWIMYGNKKTFYSRKLTFSRDKGYMLTENFHIEYPSRPQVGGNKIADTKFINEQFPGNYSGIIRTQRRPEDADGDGYLSFANGGNDCDDADPNRFPGNIEVADAFDKDEDCDYTTFGNMDRDGDGYFDAEACNIDDSGFRICGNDCDDSNPGTHINLAEVCDGIDNNCDGLVDEGLMITYFKDADRDRFGDPTISRQACRGPDFFEGAFWTNNNTDCDDSDPDKNPIDGCD